MARDLYGLVSPVPRTTAFGRRARAAV